MLYFAPAFLVMALLSGALAYGGIAGSATGLTKILFLVFLGLFVVTLFFSGRYAE